MKVSGIYHETLPGVLAMTSGISGYLTEREVSLLYLLAMHPTANGEVVEIGSFKGKSTVVIAKGLQQINGGHMHAVDPFSAPAVTDPKLDGQTSTLDDFIENLRSTDTLEAVRYFRMFSHDFEKQWDRGKKIRLLFIDGDHTYQGTKTDYDLFLPYLADGGVIAFHDVLNNQYDGPIRVFSDLLLDSSFGAAGMVDSIGWVQHIGKSAPPQSVISNKKILRSHLARLIPCYRSSYSKEKPELSYRVLFRLYRALIPHKRIDADGVIRSLSADV